MTILSAGKTDTGKTRKNNEDSYLVDEGMRLYAVADGIGGHEGGEVASRMAIEGLSQIIQKRFSVSDDAPAHGISSESDAVKSALNHAFTLVNKTIRQAAAGNPALFHMGTTMTALVFREKTAYLAHVGDSRAYRLRSGELIQVSEDHTVVAEQMRAGLLTAEQARTTPYRHIITRALGIDAKIAIDQGAIEVRPDDTFLLCTDGLTEMVEDEQIRRILSNAPPQEAAELLVREANARGGVDNITVVVVQIEDNQ
jgi:protein phosphatase